MSGRDAVLAAVQDWLNTTPPERIAEAARNQADITPALIAKYPKSQLPLALMLLGKQGLAELQDMDSISKLDWVIDYLLKHRPRVGIVLWQHSEWFLGQLHQAVTMFLAEVGQRV